MVKGFSRQVIVVHSPEEKLFEQAIFILKDGVEGVSDDALMKEANALLRSEAGKGNMFSSVAAPVWAAAGAAATALLWLLTVLF